MVVNFLINSEKFRIWKKCEQIANFYDSDFLKGTILSGLSIKNA